jgi:hypothetical protein
VPTTNTTAQQQALPSSLLLTLPLLQAKMGGYCCEECRERPEAVLRGEGRTIRRRRHREKLRARERAKRAAKVGAEAR